jgi:hypothetical protein
MYTLKPLGGDEFVVCNRADVGIGTIRKMGASWGWADGRGTHKFATQHMAALACLKDSKVRHARQKQTAALARFR